MKLLTVASIVESNNNQEVTRFEPVTFNDKPLWIVKTIPEIYSANKGCDYDTCLQIGCTSYGLYQILGANIYALGYQKSINSFVNSILDQQNIFGQFIKQKGFDPNEELNDWTDERFLEYATFYNGPGNVNNYVSAMKNANGTK